MQEISFLFMHHDSVEAEICFQSCPFVSMQEEDYAKTTRLIIMKPGREVMNKHTLY